MGSASVYSEFAERASQARDCLDDIAADLEASAAAQRRALSRMVGSWSDAPWLAAGARSFTAWARTYTSLSPKDAAHLERVGELGAKHPVLADAVIAGDVSLGRADRLARTATRDRQPFLDQVIDTLVEHSRRTSDDATWFQAVSYWADLVDQELAVHPVRPHALYLTKRLWGGGDVSGSLAPVAFETFAASLDAFKQDPDPKNAPYRRSPAERSADALHDLALFGLTHNPDHDDDDLDEWDDQNREDRAHETEQDPRNGQAQRPASGRATPGDNETNESEADDRDGQRGASEASNDRNDDPSTSQISGDNGKGDEDEERPGWWTPQHQDTTDGLGLLDRDELDDQLDDLRTGGDGLETLDLLRLKSRRMVEGQRRRARRMTKARSGVTVNVHIDIGTLGGHTLADLQRVETFEQLELRSERWRITRDAAEQLLCDSALVATLFNSNGHILDANDSAEKFNRAQRRAIAARDGHCVFPSCSASPRHCDVHHIEFREHGGPTCTSNGCLLCRFHHRLIHQLGWRLKLVNGRWTATDKHGNIWIGAPPPKGPPDADFDAASGTDTTPEGTTTGTVGPNVPSQPGPNRRSDDAAISPLRC